MQIRSRLALFLILGAVAGAASNDGKTAKNAPKLLPRPTNGIKTPGIQIPFSNLKAEFDLPAPAKPSWLFFSESLYAPNPEEGVIEKFDAKAGKAGDPLTGVSKPCARMAAGFNSLWAPSCGDGSLLRFDAKTFKKIAQVATAVAAIPGAMTVTSDSVWVLADNKTTLSRIDPDQNAVVASVRLPAACKSLVFGETSLWVACPAQNLVLHINPATNLVTKRITVSPDPQSVAIGEGSVWVFCGKDGKIDRIDPKTDKVIKTIELSVPGAVGEIAFGEGSLWVTMTGFPLTRINPAKDEVVQQFYGAGGGSLQVSTGALWLLNESKATLWKIDPKRVTATLAE